MLYLVLPFPFIFAFVLLRVLLAGWMGWSFLPSYISNAVVHIPNLISRSSHGYYGLLRTIASDFGND